MWKGVTTIELSVHIAWFGCCVCNVHYSIFVDFNDLVHVLSLVCVYLEIIFLVIDSIWRICVYCTALFQLTAFSCLHYYGVGSCSCSFAVCSSYVDGVVGEESQSSNLKCCFTQHSTCAHPVVCCGIHRHCVSTLLWSHPCEVYRVLCLTGTCQIQWSRRYCIEYNKRGRGGGEGYSVDDADLV